MTGVYCQLVICRGHKGLFFFKNFLVFKIDIKLTLSSFEVQFVSMINGMGGQS